MNFEIRQTQQPLRQLREIFLSFYTSKIFKLFLVILYV